MSQKLSTQPYKGARDFYPQDYKTREYIFNTWKKVCRSYGYQEYDGPFVEQFELYAAKSGEEIVNDQLYSFMDRGDRKVAIRPEMTPTLARMIAAEYKNLTKPIRWFSIPNLWRYEKPQRGRLREHYQLNVDIFGVDSIKADYEIISIVIDILKAFGAKEHMFAVKIGNRKMLNDFFKSINLTEEQTNFTRKIFDKKYKVKPEEFNEMLKNTAKLSDDQMKKIDLFFEDPDKVVLEFLDRSQGAKEINSLLKLFEDSNLDLLVKYDPAIIRGLDYYTGNVFEAFDLNENNPRSLCGGGRYDDLVELFIGEKITGIGFGMGDVTILNFLENWNLIPQFESEIEYFVSIWPDETNHYKYEKISKEISLELRKRGKIVLEWIEPNTKLEKQLKSADKNGAKNVIIIGTNELENNTVTIKNMKHQDQNTYSLSDFLKLIEKEN